MPAARISRRSFVRASLGALAACHLASTARGENRTAANQVRVAIMGLNGRGAALASGFCALPNCRVAYVCDVDSRALARAAEAVGKQQAAPPLAVPDFRTALDDANVDALVIAAPDHWHAPAGILACAAGKHVYVEKPCCHNPHEGELFVAAARKEGRVVTMGNQRRSWPTMQAAMAQLHGGAIGKVLFSRGWYNNRRASIGRGQQENPPEWLDWSAWQGPAPELPFRSNYVHYNWHWFWQWGTGELGNNGVHGLDLCRWGLGVDFPTRVTAGGGKYRHDDDQETPDTHVVTFDFPGGRSISWQGLSWCPRGFEGSSFGASFHGEGGSLVLLDGGYKLYDERDKLVSETTAEGNGDAPHLANFLAAVRSGGRPASDIAEAYKSSLLCCLGNIAWRTSSVLECAAETGRIRNNPAAEPLWRREYRAGWAPAES